MWETPFAERVHARGVGHTADGKGNLCFTTFPGTVPQAVVLEATVRWTGGEFVGGVEIGVERLAAASVVLWLVGYHTLDAYVLEGVYGHGGRLLVEALGTKSARFGIATIGTGRYFVGIGSTREERVDGAVGVRGTDFVLRVNCRDGIGETEGEEEELEGNEIHCG